MVLFSLSFDFVLGACSNVNDDSIYLCFHDGSSAEYKKCRVGNDPFGSFSEIRESSFEHKHTRIGASKGLSIS